MRYVNPARALAEQNLVACQNGQEVFFYTIRPVEPKEELLVWYSPEFSQRLSGQPEQPDSLKPSESLVLGLSHAIWYWEGSYSVDNETFGNALMKEKRFVVMFLLYVLSCHFLLKMAYYWNTFNMVSCLFLVKANTGNTQISKGNRYRLLMRLINRDKCIMHYKYIIYLFLK